MSMQFKAGAFNLLIRSPLRLVKECGSKLPCVIHRGILGEVVLEAHLGETYNTGSGFWEAPLPQKQTCDFASPSTHSSPANDSQDYGSVLFGRMMI